MKYNIKLTENECKYILNALRFFEDKNLKAKRKTLQEAKYQTFKGLFVNEEFFIQYIKDQLKQLNNNIEEIESIYDKIVDKMEED
jgi:hypothetical protein